GPVSEKQSASKCGRNFRFDCRESSLHFNTSAPHSFPRSFTRSGGRAFRQRARRRAGARADCAGAIAAPARWNAGLGNRARPERGSSFGPGGKKLPRHLFENRLFRCDTVPFCQVWIRSSFTAAIRFLVLSKSAARKTLRCRSWPPHSSLANRASFIACPT